MIEANIKDNVMYCKFEQLIYPKMNDNNKVFDLDRNYTLLLAGGGADADRIKYHSDGRIGKLKKNNKFVNLHLYKMS
jgi:hypothetical protein